MMAPAPALFDAYDGVVIPLPDGTVVKCEPLLLKPAVRFLRLLFRMRQGDDDAFTEILDTFPAAVGAEEEFDQFTPAELLEVVSRFFVFSRLREESEPEPEPAATKTTTPVPAATPSS